MSLPKYFRNGMGMTVGTQAGRRRRAMALALTACSTITMAQHASAAPPPSHAALPHYATAGSASPAVIGGHATHDPLWAGYGQAPHAAAPHAHRSCDCAASGKKRPSLFRRAFGSMSSGIDRVIFGRGSGAGCDCGCAAEGGELPCDAIGADQFAPMPAPRQPFGRPGPFGGPLPGRVQLSPMPSVAPGPVPVPRRESAPAASEQSDPFADDQVSAGSNPAIEQSGYYD